MGTRFVDMRTIARRMQGKDDRIAAALRRHEAMTGEVTTLAPTATGPAVTADHLQLIKATIAKDATPAELQLFLYDNARQGVHPLDKLIHFTKRSGKYTPITSIDFMRIRAAESGECAGIDDAIFTGTPMSKDFAATTTVYRLVQQQRFPFSATARWTEYKPEANDFMWKRMPFLMLGKCSEALALRKAFPKQLSGLYVKEELEQAGPPVSSGLPPGGRAETPEPGVSATAVGPADSPQPATFHKITVTPEDRADLNLPVPDAWAPFISGPEKIRGHIVGGKRNKSKTTAILDTGEEVVTIDPELGAEVIAAKAAGSEVEITTRQTGVGKEIVSIVRLEDVVL